MAAKKKTKVQDWDLKLLAIKRLYGVTQNKALARKVMPDTERHDFDNNFGKWNSSRPTSSENLKFFSRILEKVDRKDLDADWLIDCSYDDFVIILPSNIRKLVDNDYVGSSSPDIGIVRRLPIPGVMNKELNWLEEGRVDQRYMYLNVDSVQNWLAVIADQDYEVHKNCSDSLKIVLEDQAIANICEDEPVTSVFFFGCGGGIKENQITEYFGRRAVRENFELQVFLIDASYYMLVYSIDQLEAFTKRKHFTKNSRFKGIVGDFNYLSSSSAKRYFSQRRGDGASVFVLSGGTFGNIDEARFFHSINSISRKNDILILNFESYSLDELASIKDRLMTAYSTDVAKDLVLGPVRRLLDQEEIHYDPHHRRNLVEPKVIEGGEVLGSIEDTIAIEFHLDLNGKPLPLSNSKKYSLSNLVNFCQTKNFELVGEPIFAPHNAYHGQLILRRR